MKKILIIVIIVLCAGGVVQAQEYRYEIGGGIGASGYLGDVNKSNVTKHLGFAGGILFRYKPNNYRWALKANAYIGGISGNSADYDMVFPENRAYSFNSTLYDFGAQIEFNFFDYGIGASYLKLKRITPYLTLGLGGTVASVSGGQTSFAIMKIAGSAIISPSGLSGFTLFNSSKYLRTPSKS